MKEVKNKAITIDDIDMLVKRLPKEHADDVKRQLRDPILKAFDSYKSSVHYGDATETPEEHAKVLEWKQALLNLETEAFKNIPEKIKYYIQK